MKKIISLILVAILVLSMSIPAFAANLGASRDDAIVSTEYTFGPRVNSGKTMWYTYSNPALVDSGEFVQKLSISCKSEFSFSVTYGPKGNETVVDSVSIEGDENVYVNVVLTDYDNTGDYTFAITNKNSKSVKFTVVFESLPKYVITGLDVFLGENEITYDSTAPTALYSFSSGDVQITDVDGNVISTVEGGGAGTYKFTVLNKSGQIIENALLGNWGNIGYPVDLTGDMKKNTFTWNVEENDANLLIGVSNVFEDFIIKVERTGDYVSEQERIVYENYTNIHTPGSFTILSGNIVKFDINKSYNLVADSNGIYHLNTVDGPVVYVDMINDVIDLYGAFNNAYGAMVLRGIYTNAEGKTCGYEFYDSMKIYSEALDSEGYYPMTIDLENFIKAYGTAQAWFIKDYTPYDEIKNGGNPDSYWLVEAFYVVPGETTPDTTTPETTAPEATGSETTVPDVNGSETTAPEANGSETTAPEVNGSETIVPEVDGSETTAPEADTTVTNDPETEAPETEVIIEDVVVDPIVSDNSGDIKLPIVSNGDIDELSRVTYTFKFDTTKFNLKGLTGLETGDFNIVSNEDGVVVTILNISKVAAIKKGSIIFELVLVPKGEDVSAKDLNLKVEFKNEKTVPQDTNADKNGLGTAPENSPQTGDNMTFVFVVALVAIVGTAVVLRRREAE